MSEKLLGMLTARKVDLPAGTFTVYEGGAADGPPTLLLHALGREGSNWSGVAEALGARRRLIAPDQRGHGTSVWPGDYSFELMRDDALALLDALDLPRVDVIGHSMGGTVSYLLAQAEPDRVGRLVIEDTPPPHGRRELAAATPRRPDEPLPFDIRVAEPIIRQLADPDPAWWAGLSSIRSPTLIVGGGAESFVDQDELAQVAALIPDCRLVTIEAGHQVHGTRPAEFLAAVEPFLA